jgi:hypothetical protein
MLTQDLVWILEAVMHANYLFLLFSVSILWRPNPRAKGKQQYVSFSTYLLYETLT